MVTTDTIRKVAFAKSIAPHMTIRELGRLAHCSHQSVLRIGGKCKALNLNHTEIDRMDDKQLTDAFYPKKSRLTKFRQPDFQKIAEELLKKRKYRKTRTVMYLEYRDIDPESAYSSTQFFFYVNRYLKKVRAVMKQIYQPGELMSIDYAGVRLFYMKEAKKQMLNVFVATFGYSSKMFAYATPGMTVKDWMEALEKAVRYYEGVPEVIHFDNASPMVKKSGRIPTLSVNAEAFSKHYQCLCDTSRVGTPTDNPRAEAAVKFIEQRIFQKMRAMTFFSVEDVNRYLFAEVEKLNDCPLQGFKESRNILFDKHEKVKLKPLTPYPYPLIIKEFHRKVPPTYLIPYNQHEYSVPAKYIGDLVTVRVYSNHLRIFSGHTLIVEHAISNEVRGITRLVNHMPKSHQAQYKKSKDEFLKWADDISTIVYTFIEKQYEQTENKMSRAIGKRCQELQSIYKDVGKEVFVKACEHALLRNMLFPSDIRLIISAKPWKTLKQSVTKCEVQHHNIRGRDYYSNHEEGHSHVQ